MTRSEKDKCKNGRKKRERPRQSARSTASRGRGQKKNKRVLCVLCVCVCVCCADRVKCVGGKEGELKKGFFVLKKTHACTHTHTVQDVCRLTLCLQRAQNNEGCCLLKNSSDKPVFIYILFLSNPWWPRLLHTFATSEPQPSFIFRNESSLFCPFSFLTIRSR